jgi:hypothetical protein
LPSQYFALTVRELLIIAQPGRLVTQLDQYSCHMSRVNNSMRGIYEFDYLARESEKHKIRSNT